jgi:PTS system nitrogen regulatory IIA component
MKNEKTSRPLTSFFGPDDVIIRQEGLPRDELIKKMLRQLGAAHGIADPEKYLGAVLERERAVDTVVGNGIAIPHARIEGIDRPYVCVATSEGGVSFSAGKGPVHLALLALIPTEQPILYLQILKALSKILRDPAAARNVAQLASAEDVMKFFDRGGLVLPDYVCAADIMDPHFDFLRKNDSLKTAIDTFIGKEISELPVLDRDGDMIGVVTAKALLKVCLPDYLLWMEDLSPIINFEPFTEVLRNEQNTWLSEIMQNEFACVQMSSPAISVAGEMTRHDTAFCFVLNDKKLIGVIRLPMFLNKIFRE